MVEPKIVDMGQEKKTRRGSIPFKERLEKIDQQIRESVAWTAELRERREKMVQDRAAEIRKMQEDLGPTGSAPMSHT